MIMFCVTILHLWGRILDKHNQDACAVAYADDGYIKVKLSVALECVYSCTTDHLFHRCSRGGEER
jgi:hypothetical protein